jgi:hypothetical protein
MSRPKQKKNYDEHQILNCTKCGWNVTFMAPVSKLKAKCRNVECMKFGRVFKRKPRPTDGR